MNFISEYSVNVQNVHYIILIKRISWQMLREHSIWSFWYIMGMLLLNDLYTFWN